MNRKWKDIHEQLQSSMKQEIRAMREMLANMQQEEACLLDGDKKRWNQIMIERSALLEHLYELRSLRFHKTEQLEHLAKDAALPENTLFNAEDEENCEILSMSDQLTALLERMNRQNLRNRSLEGDQIVLAKQRIAFPPDPKLIKRLKATVATYPKNV